MSLISWHLRLSSTAKLPSSPPHAEKPIPFLLLPSVQTHGQPAHCACSASCKPRTTTCSIAQTLSQLSHSACLAPATPRQPAPCHRSSPGSGGTRAPSLLPCPQCDLVSPPDPPAGPASLRRPFQRRMMNWCPFPVPATGQSRPP